MWPDSKLGATKKQVADGVDMKKSVSVIMLSLFGLLLACHVEKKSFEEETYNQLEEIVNYKKKQLTQYMENIHDIAKSVTQDNEMMDLFIEKNALFLRAKQIDRDEQTEQKKMEVGEAIVDLYIKKYLMFYDVLFVNTDGFVFYTVKKKENYHQNIFSFDFANAKLSHAIKPQKQESLIDFQKDPISGEPAAFFIEPIYAGERLLGWVVLQYAINKINNMFSYEKYLGMTGEVFLVNREHLMLTDSRFFADSTILKLNLSRENIESKFRLKNGHKIVTDYRGYRVYSAFQTFGGLERDWLLIAKIDEDEVITEGYRKNREIYYDALLGLIDNEGQKYSLGDYNVEKSVEVNIDEFKRAVGDTVLYTHGVSTCMALVITLPGKFSYMAHISAHDWIYGGEQTDLLNSLIKRLADFEVVNNDRRKLKFTIITPRVNYEKKVLDLLVDHHILLSQITFLTNSKARYANILHDHKNQKTFVDWKLAAAQPLLKRVSVVERSSVGQLLKRILSPVP